MYICSHRWGEIWPLISCLMCRLLYVYVRIRTNMYVYCTNMDEYVRTSANQTLTILYTILYNMYNIVQYATILYNTVVNIVHIAQNCNVLYNIVFWQIVLGWLSFVIGTILSRIVQYWCTILCNVNVQYCTYLLYAIFVQILYSIVQHCSVLYNILQYSWLTSIPASPLQLRSATRYSLHVAAIAFPIAMCSFFNIILVSKSSSGATPVTMDLRAQRLWS